MTFALIGVEIGGKPSDKYNIHCHSREKMTGRSRSCSSDDAHASGGKTQKGVNGGGYQSSVTHLPTLIWHAVLHFLCTRASQVFMIDTTVWLALCAWFFKASFLWAYRTRFHSVFILETCPGFRHKKKWDASSFYLPHLHRFGKDFQTSPSNTIPPSFRRIRIQRYHLLLLLL